MTDKPGPTGEFPRGKISEDDQGELKVAISTDLEKGIVRIDFGKSVDWLGLDAATAQAFGVAILEHGRELRLKGK